MCLQEKQDELIQQEESATQVGESCIPPEQVEMVRCDVIDYSPSLFTLPLMCESRRVVDQVVLVVLATFNFSCPPGLL